MPEFENPFNKLISIKPMNSKRNGNTGFIASGNLIPYYIGYNSFLYVGHSQQYQRSINQVIYEIV